VKPSAFVRLGVETCIYADREHAICVQGRTSIMYSMAAPNAQSLRAWTRSVEAVDGPLLVLVVIDSGARAPDAPGRDAIQQLRLRHQHRIAGFAYVVEGEGFKAAAVRSALSAMSLASRFTYPQRVTATVGEAAPWLVHRLPAPLRAGHDASAIVATVDALRAALRAVGPAT
jgi:hypothetical protein